MEKTAHNLLFVYGTLLIPDNHFAKFLNSNARFIADGKLEGALFDLGNYPGAIYSASSRKYILGCVFQIEDMEKVFEELDKYEGIGSDDCEYTREITPVLTDIGELHCWVYLYIQNTKDKQHIESGDYLKYIREKNRQQAI